MPIVLSRSKKLFTEAKKVIPSGVNSPVRYFEPYPFFVKKSNGSHIWDADGKQLIDFCNGYGALLLGHRRKEIISAVSRQLKQGTLFALLQNKKSPFQNLLLKITPRLTR